jgi:hypothetical protein
MPKWHPMTQAIQERRRPRKPDHAGVDKRILIAHLTMEITEHHKSFVQISGARQHSAEAGKSPPTSS